MNELIIGIFWALYYAIHSAMASARFKLYLRLTIPTLYPYYRSVYSFFATINLLLLIWLHLLVPSELLFDPSSAKIVGCVLIFFSVIILVIAGKTYGASFLFREGKSKNLVRSGLNAHVRHPLYFGTLLLIVGLFLVSPNSKNFIFMLVSILYLIVGSKLEERKLITEFGQEYEDYRKRVKMLIPWVF
ncbi:MAG: isoprenylcysteine carboxylmethyltransferase family protein [Cryomorphaceae bacterium]